MTIQNIDENCELVGFKIFLILSTFIDLVRLILSIQNQFAMVIHVLQVLAMGQLPKHLVTLGMLLPPIRTYRELSVLWDVVSNVYMNREKKTHTLL